MTDKPTKQHVVLEPRPGKWTWIFLVAALLVANVVAGVAIWRFDVAVDRTVTAVSETVMQSDEQRCRALIVNKAIEVVLSQQALITKGLADLNSGEVVPDEVTRDFVEAARELAPIANEVIRDLRVAVDECQTS